MSEMLWKILQQSGQCFEQSYLEAKINGEIIIGDIMNCFTGRNVTTEFPNI